jgi:hypothetical protein
MSKVQQLITQDEITAGGIEQGWLDAICKKIVPEQLPAEITSERMERDGDTHVTTIWSKGRVVGLAIRQRDMANYTVLTLVEIEK